MFAKHSTNRKALSLFATTILILVITLVVTVPNRIAYPRKEYVVYETYEKTNIFKEYERYDYQKGKWRDFSDEDVANMSVLSKILFLDEKPPKPRLEKNFKILVWKYGKTIENRHIKHFSNKEFDPFKNCSVRNCKITYKDEDLKDASLVLFHMHRMKGVRELPNQDNRDPKQIWAFLTDESPFNMFLNGVNNKLSDYNNAFNWSMTYSFRSDIPVPYGRTVPLTEPNEANIDDLEAWKKTKKSDVLIAILGSNCGSRNRRWEYVRKLKEDIPVDMYGGCGTLKCPGHFKADCEPIKNYMFYLAFENSNCDEYITEKLWWNAYSKNSIPIVMGAPESTLSKFLPPHSYINVENFASPRDLANYIKYLIGNPSEFQIYFQWKQYFQVLQEHGYFQSESFHYCRICEALNYNSMKTKVYERLENFWSTNSCHPSWDVKYD